MSGASHEMRAWLSLAWLAWQGMREWRDEGLTDEGLIGSVYQETCKAPGLIFRAGVAVKEGLAPEHVKP